MKKIISFSIAVVMLVCIIMQISIISVSASAISPWDMVKKMGKGINLGCTLEAPLEGAWGLTAYEHFFDDYKEAGFTNVRIPVRWDLHMEKEYPYTIDPLWLDRVEEVIDWSLSRDLVTIINSHHDNWIKENYSENIERFESMWAQISERFKDKSENLLFEICNEPFGNITNVEVNDMNKRVLDIIRDENPTRIVIIGGAMWNSFYSLINLVELPSDPYLIGSFHYYEPGSFSHLSQGTWGTETDKLIVDYVFDKIKNWSDENNIPVYLGEFGVLVYADTESRIRYYDTISDEALSRGFSFSVWDNGTFGTPQYDMAFYHRDTGIFDQDILNAVIDDPEISTYTPIVIPTKTPPPPPTPMYGEVTLLDFEDPVQLDYWVPYSLYSTVDKSPGEGNPGSSMSISYYTYDSAAFWGIATLVPDGGFSQWSKLSFDVKSQNANEIRVILVEEGIIDGQEGEHWEYKFTPGTSWSTKTIPFEDFIKRPDCQPPMIDDNGVLDLYKLAQIHFIYCNTNPDTFSIDNMKVIGITNTATPTPTPSLTPTPTPTPTPTSTPTSTHPLSQTVCINEVMAANTCTLKDGDGENGGDYSDWIELYNPGEQSVDLTGYTLSDSGASWIFSQGAVPAKGHLLVFASDKDKAAEDGQLHTNFKISSSGETVTLKSPDGTLVDSVTTVALRDDQSYGRKTDGSLEFVIFSESTPCSANIYTPASTAVKMPVFSYQGGFYEDEFDLQISTDEPGVKIYYTLDGSDPVSGNNSAIKYTGSLKIKSRTGDPNELSMIKIMPPGYENLWKDPKGEVFKCSIVKAAAIREDGTQSKIVTHTYFVDPNMKSRYSIPVISLVTDKANLFDSETGIYTFPNCLNKGSEWERPMHIEFFEPDGSLGFSQNIGTRINGGYTRMFPQKAFRLYADGGYDDTNKFKYEVFPGLTKKVNGEELSSFERLILRNSGNDNQSLMFRDGLLQSLVSHLKIDTQAYRPSVVFLDGEYWGIYNIRERYDDEYLKYHYDLDKDKVAMLDIWEVPEVLEGNEEDALAYMNEIINSTFPH